MLHVAQFGKKLVKEKFQAWDYGPIIPRLYNTLNKYNRTFINEPIPTDESDSFDDTQLEFLKKIDETFGDALPGLLVAATHLKGGAWSKNYHPGACSYISDKDIEEEADSLNNDGLS